MNDPRTRTPDEQKALERIELDAREVGEARSEMDLLLIRRGWDEAMYWRENQGPANGGVS